MSRRNDSRSYDRYSKDRDNYSSKPDSRYDSREVNDWNSREQSDNSRFPKDERDRGDYRRNDSKGPTDWNRNPPPRDDYGRNSRGPPPRDDYRNESQRPPQRSPPPRRDDWNRDRNPPPRDDFRRDDPRGPPTRDNYRGPPVRDDYRNNDQRGPPRDDWNRDRNPPPRDDYRRDEQRGPPPRNDYRDSRDDPRGPPQRRDDWNRDRNAPPRDDYRRDDTRGPPTRSDNSNGYSQDSYVDDRRDIQRNDYNGNRGDNRGPPPRDDYRNESRGPPQRSPPPRRSPPRNYPRDDNNTRDDYQGEPITSSYSIPKNPPPKGPPRNDLYRESLNETRGTPPPQRDNYRRDDYRRDDYPSQRRDERRSPPPPRRDSPPQRRDERRDERRDNWNRDRNPPTYRRERSSSNPSSYKSSRDNDPVKFSPVPVRSNGPPKRTSSALPKSGELNYAIRTKGDPNFGILTTCKVNHLTINVGIPKVYQYHIHITPSIEKSAKRNRLIGNLVKTLGDQYLFDGYTMLFSPKLIKDQRIEVQNFQVEINCVKELVPSASTTQLYNILFKKILRNLEMVHLGRQFFDPKESIKIPQHKIEVWPGFFTSIYSTVKGATLCADIAHKVLRTDTVLNFINDVKRNSRGDYRKAVNAQIRGSVVLTRYNNRTYTVDSVDWDKSALSEFNLKDSNCTFMKYYEDVHNLRIRDQYQPLLKVISKKLPHPIYLVPEFCCMTGLSERLRADFKIMQSLDEYTKVNPAVRQDKIIEFIDKINSSKSIQNSLSEWDVKINNDLMTVDSVLLPTETIDCGDQSLRVSAKGEWRHSSILQPSEVRYCLFIFPEKAKRDADRILDQFRRFSLELNVKFAPPKQVPIHDEYPEHFEKAIEDNIHEHTNMVICLLTKKGPSYDAIKYLCCKKLGVASQCITTRTIRNPKRMAAICSKIVQQINCKIGGTLWRVKVPLRETMIIGVDVCSDNFKGQTRSVVGFCATTNADFTKYFTAVKFQYDDVQLIAQLAECYDDALENFKTINGNYPVNIIVYRAGAADGQMDEILQKEVLENLKVIASKGYDIKLTEIIVQKRIHTRIFAYSHSRIQNVNPGTLIDRECVSNEYYDFYMIPQYVHSGTATPSRFIVIYDEIGLPAHELQQLTYKLCHLYFNWAGTIRVPAPCQYAYKAAFLVSQSVHDIPHKQLENCLYFL